MSEWTPQRAAASGVLTPRAERGPPAQPQGWTPGQLVLSRAEDGPQRQAGWTAWFVLRLADVGNEWPRGKLEVGARTQAEGRVTLARPLASQKGREVGDSSTKVHAPSTGHRPVSTPQPLTVLSHQPGPQRAHALHVQDWANPLRQRARSATQSWQPSTSRPRHCHVPLWAHPP